MALALRRHLLQCYGSFADKRIKKVETGRVFIADDRSDADLGADGQLFGYFCMIFAAVDSDTALTVDLRGNLPQSASVDAIIQRHGGTLNRSGPQPSAQLVIERGNIAALRELADAFDAIVAPGRRYSTANYKYVCPRTATALRRLAKHLESYAWRKSGFF